MLRLDADIARARFHGAFKDIGNFIRSIEDRQGHTGDEIPGVVGQLRLTADGGEQRRRHDGGEFDGRHRCARHTRRVVVQAG